MEIEAQPGDILFFNSFGLVHANGSFTERFKDILQGVNDSYRFSLVLFIHHDLFQQSEMHLRSSNFNLVRQQNLNVSYENQATFDYLSDHESPFILKLCPVAIKKMAKPPCLEEIVNFSDNVNATNDSLELHRLTFHSFSNIILYVLYLKVGFLLVRRFVRHLDKNSRRKCKGLNKKEPRKNKPTPLLVADYVYDVVVQLYDKSLEKYYQGSNHTL